MRTRVKICGITTVEDAWAAIDAGADALGFVFFEKSARAVSIQTASAICQQLPAFITRVALFVDASVETVNTILTHVEIDLIQFHGAETDEFCRQFNKPFIKALQVKSKIFLDNEMAKFPHAKALLLDTFVPGVAGGSGQTFDWDLFTAAQRIHPSQPLILAGGLTPENVFDAIQQVTPFAVDVSGGVEREKGIKDTKRIASFLARVMQADAALLEQ
jgi:phosphoribosylanthranilate isomerase